MGKIKTFTCDRCKPFGGKKCTLQCDDIAEPTHCPCTDSMKPYATWEEDQASKNMIEIRTDKGLDGMDIDFIQHIEKEIDKAMNQNGFTRSSSGKAGDELIFNYRQFGVCHPHLE